jgi:nicotinate-nucleotide--dimethylbenzimidazole phosphoribosyltransferase
MSLGELVGLVAPLDQAAMDSAMARQEGLTKPRGSLGRLEDLSIQLAGITGNARPSTARKAIIVMAGDHGVVAQGVSAYPAEVTPQMVMNILGGGAAINALARQTGARVVVVDIGVAVDMGAQPGLISRNVGHGTADFTQGPAMTASQAEQAIRVGMEVCDAEWKTGLDLVATGEMGIGNTTPSSAIIAAMSGLPPAEVTGRGTGVGDEGLSRKVMAIDRALAANRPDPADAFDVLCKVGGYEIAGLAGVIIQAAHRRVPVVIDGFVSGAAAVIAAGLVPAVKSYMIASHRSVEVGHSAMLDLLGIQPIMDLNLRLGEGTGAALAFNVVEASARILNEMATFAEAGVSGKED